MARKNYIERRRYKRKDIYCLIRYNVHGESGASGTMFSSIRNISGGGALLRSSKYLAVGSELDTSINLLPINKVIRTLGKVVWFEKVKITNYYLSGIEFTAIGEEDRNTIIQFAEK